VKGIGNSFIADASTQSFGQLALMPQFPLREALESLIGLSEQLHEHVPLRFGTPVIHTGISIGSIETFTAAFTFHGPFSFAISNSRESIGVQHIELASKTLT